MLALALPLLSGCVALGKQVPFAEHRSNVHTIGIAAIEYDHRLTVRRDNPMFVLIGASGLIIQQIAMEERSSRYAARLGNFAYECEHKLLQVLQTGLSRQGYRTTVLRTGFWQAMKLARAHRMMGIDAVLRVKIKRLGFRAASVDAAYVPSLIISVNLIRPISRELLYADTIAVGYGPSGSHMSHLEHDPYPFAYSSFATLLDHARESRQGLLIALQLAAERISHDLGPDRVETLAEAATDKAAPLKQ